jgi:hypothetical protein
MKPTTHAALSQAALNMVAKTSDGRKLLRTQRDQSQRARDKAVAEHESRMADFDALIRRMGIALGEIDA